MESRRKRTPSRTKGACASCVARAHNRSYTLNAFFKESMETFIADLKFSGKGPTNACWPCDHGAHKAFLFIKNVQTHKGVKCYLQNQLLCFRFGKPDLRRNHTSRCGFRTLRKPPPRTESAAHGCKPSRCSSFFELMVWKVGNAINDFDASGLGKCTR